MHLGKTTLCCVGRRRRSSVKDSICTAYADLAYADKALPQHATAQPEFGRGFGVAADLAESRPLVRLRAFA